MMGSERLGPQEVKRQSDIQLLLAGCKKYSVGHTTHLLQILTIMGVVQASNWSASRSCRATVHSIMSQLWISKKDRA